MTLDVPGDGDQAFDLNEAAATLASSSTDIHILLKVLAEQLTDVLGDRLVVERAGRFRHADQIKSVRITVGGDELTATVAGSSVDCTIGRVSGGIRIRSERVGMDEWLKTLLGALQAEAAHSDAARQALEHIVIGGT